MYKTACGNGFPLNIPSEINGGGGGASSADDVSYDNTSSGLTATDVQEAIDEVVGAVEEAANAEVYSTDEVKIGKWLNDDLYRKVYHVAALPNTTTLDVPTGLTNVKYVGVRGVAYGDSNVLPLPYSAPGSLASLVQLSMSGDNIRIVTGQDRSNREADIIIEYVKTVTANTRKGGKK